MSEWWTYSPSDFLLFSARTYYRLFELHNTALWPFHLLTLALGVTVVTMLVRSPTRRHARVLVGALGVLWGWVAWAFLWHRYASINWAATWAAWAFVVEGVALLWAALTGENIEVGQRRGWRASVGLAVLVLAVAAYPLLAILTRGESRQAEVFGIAPDPTVLGTLGVLCTARGRGRALLAIIPLLWAVVSAVTLSLLGAPEAWVLGGSALAVLIALAPARTRAPVVVP